MAYLSTVKIKGLKYPIVVQIDDSELMKRPLYERIIKGWSFNYIMRYSKVKEYKLKRGKCGPLI